MDGQRMGEAPKRVVEETKRLYADLLSKPLDDRQLSKPSFKLIQDVTKSLITETRTLRNVFNPTDFETGHKTWDRKRRCEFVQRLIDFAANHKQPVVGCVAAKLVAGLEPVKANELLQSLARIAQARLSGQDANSSKRPRTFTRQTPSSSSPAKQKSEVKSSIKISTSNRGSGRRSIPDDQTRAATDRIAPSRSRDLSAGSVKADRKKDEVDIGRQETGSDGSTIPVARSSLSKMFAPDDARPENEFKSLSTSETNEKASSGADSQSQTATKRQSMQPKLSSPSLGPNQAGLQSMIVSESDVGRNVQQLRLSLDQLRSNLSELDQFAVKFKSELVAYKDQYDKLVIV